MTKRPFRIVIAALLVGLAAALVLGIVSLHRWGGSMEAMLLVFGDRVWVTLDSGRPRLWLLLATPGVLFVAAVSLLERRPGE